MPHLRLFYRPDEIKPQNHYLSIIEGLMFLSYRYVLTYCCRIILTVAAREDTGTISNKQPREEWADIWIIMYVNTQMSNYNTFTALLSMNIIIYIIHKKHGIMCSTAYYTEMRYVAAAVSLRITFVFAISLLDRLVFTINGFITSVVQAISRRNVHKKHL